VDAGRGGVRFADADWRRRQAGFRLEEREGVIGAGVSYVEANRHYGGAAFCWGMYLRLLKRYCEMVAVAGYAGSLGA
jgi:hypothetical protein